MELPTATIEQDVQIESHSKTKSFGKTISLVSTLRHLDVGQGFRIDEHGWRGRVTAAASYLGMKVRTTKLEDNRLFVQRIQ